MAQPSSNSSAYEYHDYVPDKRKWFADIDYSDPYKYSTSIVNNPELQPLWTAWKEKLEVPFHGITCDGRKKEGLYVLRNEEAPTPTMVQAARALLRVLSPSEREIVTHSLDSEDWRKWMNPEFVLFKCGLRLEDLEEAKIESIMGLVKSSLSDNGFNRVRGAMKTNKFLGEICDKKGILNEHSYFFAIFGEPSETEPWSYMLFGHHLALNVFVARRQMVIGPVFIGAEPNIIDEGPDKGITLCAEESELGLRLMQSLSPELQKKAQLYLGLHDSAMPEDRWNPADQRHLAGAFQDNRIIPYEGILATEITIEQQDLLMSITSASTLLPPGPLELRLADVREHLAETYFCWIGGFSSADPFYYRIQSPVALFEFDHHSGVFLTNEEPAKYHIHTIQRLPNGNDYGRSLRELLREGMAEDEPEYKV